MSFVRGRASYRVFQLAASWPSRFAERLQSAALPSLDHLESQPLAGWTGGRHPLDVPVREEHVARGGLYRWHFVEVRRRIPASYLRAMIEVETLARMDAEGVPVLRRAARSEVRRQVEERLLAQAQPTLRVIELVGDAAAGLVWASALSPLQADRIGVEWHRTFGQKLELLDPGGAAMQLGFADPRRWPAGERAEVDPGAEFFTWLWFRMEIQGGDVQSARHGRFAYLLEGPICLGYDEGDGALELVARKGDPMSSADTRAALRSGKYLLRCRVTLARGDRQWSATIEARSFAVRSARWAEDGERDSTGDPLGERISQLREFHELWMDLYRSFLEVRTDPRRWSSEVSELRRWRERTR